MRKHRASKRYATALFELCSEQKAVDAVSQDMAAIAEVLNTTPELVTVLESPDVSKKEKTAILEQLFKGKVHPVVSNLLQLLLHKNREMLLPEIADWYHELEDLHKNIQRAELITAVPLAEKQKQTLAATFEAKTKKKIIFEEKVDKTILGGFVIKMADKVIDASIRSSLKRMESRLTVAQ